MSKENRTRGGCIDVFRAFLVENAIYDSSLEIPRLQKEMGKPDKLISFSNALRSAEYDAWVHFYEDDVKIERFWNRPNTYLPVLKKFSGVISPDFSLYRDMPLVMQQWNVYRGRALGHWMQENGIPVVPNIRFGDERTYELSCAGIQKGGVIAIGSHGCLKLANERRYFKAGLEFVMDKLDPIAVAIYGAAPDEIFAPYRARGIEILQFDSDFMQSRKAVSA